MADRRFVWALAASACAHVGMCQAVYELKVEGMPNPINIGTPTPRFSWILDPSLKQAGYDIKVITANDNVVWESNFVASTLNEIVYAGDKLLSDSDYLWSINVQASNGSWYGSSLSSFSTALLEPSDWQGSWIGGNNQLRYSFQLPSSLPAPTGISRARAYVTAVGCYELWVNGRIVHRGGYNMTGNASYVNPGFSTIYTERVLYNTWDITSLINIPISGSGSAENVFGLRIGSCKYGYLGEFCVDGAAKCNRAIVQISVEDSNGVITHASSGNATWLGAQSPILVDHFYNGEVFDARLIEADWSSPGFVPGPNWTPVTVMPSPTQKLESHQMPMIEPYETLNPVSVKQLSGASFAPNSYIFDLGKNGAGICTIVMPGPTTAGINVTAVFAELTDGTTGGAYIQFPCPAACCLDGGNCANQNFTYITGGSAAGAQEWYRPTFAYSGFRYIQISNWPSSSAPTVDLITCDITSSGVESAGAVNFNSSSGVILNMIQSAIVRSQRSNMHSIPTDCPQREKRGWMADAHVSSAEAALNLQMRPVYENWLQTHADTLNVGCGNLTANWTCPKWSNQAVDVDIMSPAAPGWGAAMSVRAADDFYGGALAYPSDDLPNCYICCYGRTGE